MAIRHQTKSTNRSRWDYEDFLAGKGAKYVGEGMFATVYKLPKANTVLKVMGSDPAYFEYVKTIIKYQHNPFFPRIKKFVTHVPKKGRKYTVVEMEKLTERCTDKTWNMCNTLEDALHIYDDDDVEYGTKYAMKVLTRRFKTARKKHLRELVDIMVKLFRKHGSDLHEGNLLWRGNQPVITDPVA